MRRFVIVMSVFAAVMASAAQAQALEQTVSLPDAEGNDNFGRSVAVEGDTLVVGAPNTDNNAGAVYVFKRTGDTWAFNAKLTASDASTVVANGDQLGTSVAIDGDKIVAGAPKDDVGANADQGSVYVFDTTGAAARTEVAHLFSSNGAGNHQFGTSVAIDGDTIVVGAPNVTTNTASEGMAYTFARTGTTPRTESAKLSAAGGTAGARLGSSIAIDGDKIVAGAPFSTSPHAVGAGTVYTFNRTGASTRVENGEIYASDGANGDELGLSVAIDGDTIVAGADQDDSPNTDQGSVYTFARTGMASRTETAKLTASDGAGNSRLGGSVAIDGSKIVAGAFGDTVSAVTTGSAYEFARTGANPRNQVLKRTQAAGSGSGDLFGRSIDVDGTTTAVGAQLDGVTPASDEGSVTIYFDAAQVVTPPPPATDTTAPQTSAIGGKTKLKAKKPAKFTFSSNEAGSTFECRIDKDPFKSCTSPFSVKTKKLKGKHTIEVRATDAAGNTDATPSSLKFKVKKAKKKK